MMRKIDKIHISIMSAEVFRQVSKEYPYDHIVIRYKTPRVNYHPTVLSKFCRGQVELFVHDYTPKEAMGNPQIILFSKNHAKKILELVEREKNNVYHIICVCDAGISRSSATAAAISKILYNDDTFVFDNPRYLPNSHIYSTILRTYFEGKNSV